jgi:hypothetical protein
MMISMRRLLTSNSNTRYLRLGLLMLGWLILLEVILRQPIVQSRLERYLHNPVWYSPYVPQRLNLIHNNLDADIWFVGSSSVVTGFKPAAIDPLLNNQTKTKYKSLNLGLLGMYYVDHLENYLNDAFLPLDTPKVVVLGTFPLMFAYSPKGYSEDSVEYEATRDHSSELNRQLSAWLYDHLALYKLVHTFRYLISETPAPQATDTPTGYVDFNQTIKNITVPSQASGTTNDLLEKNLVLVKHLRDTLQSRGIQLVFINMPMYDPEMRQYPGGASNYQAYVSRLATFLADEHIPFLDVWQAIENEYDQHLPAADFMDFPHLNDTGATDVSPFIAQFLAKVLEPTSSPSP